MRRPARLSSAGARPTGSCRARRMALARHPRPLGVLVELVLEAIHQRLPARLDDVERYANRTPALLAVARFDQHANRRRTPRAAAEHAHLVVEQTNVLDEIGRASCR